MARRTSDDAISRRAGFTLIEMVVVLGLLVVLMAVGSAALAELLQVRKAAGKTQERLVRRGELADQFRADVALAVATPLANEYYRASPTCLILQLANHRQIVYQWTDGRLERLLIETGRTKRRPFDLGDDVTAVQFSHDKAGSQLIELTVTEMVGKRKLERQSTIAAALGGDVR